MPTARIVLSAALLAFVLLPAPGWAQAAPLAGVVKTLFDRVTPNATTPNPANTAANIDHGAHFFLGGENLNRATRELNAALATQLSTFPLASSSGGFTYSINPGGDVVPTSTTFGPSFAERAVTIGRGKLNFGYTLPAHQLQLLRRCRTRQRRIGVRQSAQQLLSGAGGAGRGHRFPAGVRA